VESTTVSIFLKSFLPIPLCPHSSLMFAGRPMRLSSWMPFDNFRALHHFLKCCTLITPLLAVNFGEGNIFCP
jgi:hypothetical protein